VREFEHVVEICRTDTEWLEAVDAAVSGHGASSSPARIAVARANSWDRRIDQIEMTLDQLASDGPRCSLV
jgi:hypothetical protein